MKKHTAPILLTLVCFAPHGHLILDILSKEGYNELLKNALLIIPCYVIVILSWCIYIKNKVTEDEQDNNEDEM